MTLERFLNVEYHPVVCNLDAKIPFCEYFVIPYYFWFIFIIGMLAYTFFYETDTFSDYMKFIIITYTITLVVYIIYPTSQELRPVSFKRDNIFTDIVRMLYDFDTNTNVCPSLHVIGSFAVYFAARKSRRFGMLWWRVAFFAMALIISISTVFLKQHSAIDIFAALLVCAVSYPLVYTDMLKVKKLNKVA